MGYSHMFYAVDLDRLRAVSGSKDLELFEQIRRKSDSLEDDELDALRRIVMGECLSDPDTEHCYGYALKAICEYLGERIGSDVAVVRDHPYRSQLVANGAPVEIPYTRRDFPQIGYLAYADLAKEYKLATETKPRAKWTLGGFFLRKISGGILGREPNAEEIAEDMRAYAETLKECIDRKRSLISFRH